MEFLELERILKIRLDQHFLFCSKKTINLWLARVCEIIPPMLSKLELRSSLFSLYYSSLTLQSEILWTTGGGYPLPIFAFA